MADTLYIGNDINTAEMKVLFCERDFIDLVAEKLGGDAARFLEDIIDMKNEYALEAMMERRRAEHWRHAYELRSSPADEIAEEIDLYA